MPLPRSYQSKLWGEPEAVEEPPPTFIDEARRVAYGICKERSFVTTGELHEYFPEVPSGPWWGSVLKEPYFTHVGTRQTSRREAHKRAIHVWALGNAWR
jgi:hypothetical protein